MSKPLRVPSRSTEVNDRAWAAPLIEWLTCRRCTSNWHRQITKGRKPHYCPPCAGFTQLAAPETSTASGLASDGAASHIEVERLVGRLQIVQADIARRYLDGGLEFARAVAELEEQALVPHGEALIKYFNEYRSYVTAYTEAAVRRP